MIIRLLSSLIILADVVCLVLNIVNGRPAWAIIWTLVITVLTAMLLNPFGDHL